MKKLILLVSFFSLALFSAKDNVVFVKKSVQLCGVTVTYYSGGKEVGTAFFSKDLDTYSECQNFQASVRRMLLKQGYTIQEQ